jgi:uncharacterized protein DUF3455
MKVRSRMQLAIGSLAGILMMQAEIFAEEPPRMPATIAAPDEVMAATFHAEGAQLYECKPDGNSKLVWQFREPIAALMLDGKTVGTHYAGPSWQLVDGSSVRAKAAGSAPGASANDIPWLKLEVTERRGNGTLSQVTTVQRINTRGGTTKGPCETAGEFRGVPYSADYVFLRKDD